jgi:hypothetical protein
LGKVFGKKQYSGLDFPQGENGEISMCKILQFLTLGIWFTLLGGATLAQDQIEECEIYPEDSETLVCMCPPNIGGAVWGSGPYTGDSNICAAAVHAGVLLPNGGVVIAFLAPGQDLYPASTANGITTSDWGGYRYSFGFGATQAATTEPLLDQTCNGIPTGVVKHSCFCPPFAEVSLNVWGSGPYTTDSDICTAGLHGGSLTKDGGWLQIFIVDNVQQFSTTTWNNVTTQEWSGSGPGFVLNYNAWEE